MITYNDIYEASRKERYSESLQPLIKNFPEEVKEYLIEKKSIAAKEDDSFSDMIIKANKQVENAITLFKELMVRRRKKILSLVLIASETGISKQDFENMLEFEKELFEKLMKCIEVSNESLGDVVNGDSNRKKYMVSFIEDVEEFLGFDGKKIGPFKKGERAKLPREVANILIDDGKAEKIGGD